MNFVVVLLLFACCVAVNPAVGAVISDERDPKRVKLGCTISIGDLGDVPHPLYLIAGTNKQLPVRLDGNVELSGGEEIELFCSSTYANPTGKSGSQTATCVSDELFKIDQTVYKIKDITCSSWPAYSARKTGGRCNGGVIIESGFEIGTRFLKQLEICFNEDEEAIRYVYHTLSPENTKFKSKVERLNFNKAGFFGRKNVDKIYSQTDQKTALEKVLGNRALQFINVSKQVYLARGHFAAKTDFIYPNEQRGTFLFVNAAPQWQTFNAGNWARVEDNVRNWVGKKRMHVECWTGAYGIATLPNDRGVETPLYLTYDKNGNGLIPVPKLYFRVIIEPSTKLGLVLLGVNNPHLTMNQIQREYIICDDVSDQLDFLTWQKTEISVGYSYACDVNDFAKKNPNLPKFDVKGLLV